MRASITNPKGESMKRRSFVHALALGAALALGSATAVAQGKTVKVGVLHSLSGTMAISETVLKVVALNPG